MSNNEKLISENDDSHIFSCLINYNFVLKLAFLDYVDNNLMLHFN